MGEADTTEKSATITGFGARTCADKGCNRIPLQTGSADCAGVKAAEAENAVFAAGGAADVGSGTAITDGTDVDVSNSEGGTSASSVSGPASAVGSGSLLPLLLQA